MTAYAGAAPGGALSVMFLAVVEGLNGAGGCFARQEDGSTVSLASHRELLLRDLSQCAPEQF